LLDLAGLPFVGAGVLGSAIGMDKMLRSDCCCRQDSCGAVVTVHRADWERDAAAVQKQIEKKFRYPLFVKPAALGCRRMSKVHSRKELRGADLASEFAMRIGRTRSERKRNRSFVLAIMIRRRRTGEIVPHREFYDYTAKYLEEGTR